MAQHGSTARNHRRPLVGATIDAPAPVRLAIPARSALRSDTAVIGVDDQLLGEHDDHGPLTVDAIVVDQQCDETVRASRRALAREHHLPVLEIDGPLLLRAIDKSTIDTDESRSSSQRGARRGRIVRTPRSPTTAMYLADPGPTRWRRNVAAHIGVRLPDPNDATVWEAIATVSGDLGIRPHVLIDADGRVGMRRHRRHDIDVSVLAERPDERALQLQSLRGVLDIAAVDDDPTRRAMWVLEAAARRLPVMTTDRTSLGSQLAKEVLDAIPSIDGIRELADPDVRERVGVTLRRAVLAAHDSRAVWTRALADVGLPIPPPPSISVLLATNRPELTVHALERIDRQTHPDVEAVIAVHGELDQRRRDELRARAQRPLELVEMDAAASLGDVLNAALAAASGRLVAKMDDDDHYSRHHLTDLVDALRTSGATLVGKGSEFVHLAAIDTTIRRFTTGVETANRNLAGGTLLLAREDLLALGGWQRARRSVDQRLLDDVLAAGGRIHRTHGLGFILERHGDGHTWDASTDYFLQQAVRQWPGLATHVAGVDDAPGA